MISVLLYIAALAAGLTIGSADAQTGPRPMPPQVMAPMAPMAPGPAHMPATPGPPREWMLAGILSAMETAIGIRPDQAAAWRGFTDALQAMMQPPRLPQTANAEAFAIPLALAEDARNRAARSADLVRAVEALKQVLTPEQIERVKRFEEAAHRLHRPMP